MKKKPEKLALTIIFCMLSIILIGGMVSLYGLFGTGKNDYNFQKLHITVEEGYFDDIVYEESTKTLNATLIVKMHFRNQTKKEIGIDTNILSFKVRNFQEITSSSGCYLNNRTKSTTTVGDCLGENYYQTIKAKDVSVVKFSIPVSISMKFDSETTNASIYTELCNFSMSWDSKYFNPNEYGKLMCTASYNITRI